MLFSRTSGRRQVRFATGDDLLRDVERLASGYRPLGRWTLAQICEHLANTQNFSLDGGKPDFEMSRLFRVTIGRIALCVLLWFRFIPERQGDVAPPADPDLDTALERLRRSTHRIMTEPMAAVHPIFGRLSQAQWRRFHLYHAEHHLSFLLPA